MSFSFALVRNRKIWIWLKAKLFPNVPGLAALLLMFEQGGQPSLAKKIFSTLPYYVIYMSHTSEIRVGYVSLISVLWTHKQGCCSQYSVWLKIFLSAALPQYTEITVFLKKFNTFWCFMLSESQHSSEHSPFKDQSNFGQRTPFPTWDFFCSLKDFLASVLGSCETPAAGDNAGLFPPPGKKGDLTERPTL